LADESVVGVIQRYLQSVTESGIPVRYGVLFGSHATGRAHEWSDIDLLIISPQFDDSPSREIINLLWRLASRTDSRIEPIPVGEKQYDVDDTSAVIEIGRREGLRIPLAG